jgi:hypothetical protein
MVSTLQREFLRKFGIGIGIGKILPITDYNNNWSRFRADLTIWIKLCFWKNCRLSYALSTSSSTRLMGADLAAVSGSFI